MLIRYGQIAYAPEDGAGGAGGADGSATAPWYEGKASPEHVAVWQNKQWDLSDPVKLTSQLTESYRNAERMIGVPSAELLRIPKADDEAGQKAFWQKFGVPAEPAGYGLAEVKFADGTPVDEQFLKSFSEQAATLNVPATAAKGLLQHFMKHLEGSAASEATATATAQAAATAALRANWGANWETNMFVAKQAATALGVTPEIVATLETQIGYDKVMEFFRQVGTRIGEDKYVSTPGAGGNKGVMTREQAVQQKATLIADKDWAARYTRGDKKAFDEMYALNTLIAGGMTG